MPETAALALLPSLLLKPRDRASETEAVLGIAGWTAQITPALVLDLPGTMALDVTASLKLFGNIDKIIERLNTGIRDLGFTAALGCAPTVRAACWFARSGLPPSIRDIPDFTAAVSALSLKALDSARDRMDAFEAIGAVTIADLQALPRDGLARRFGSALLDEIDRGLGRLPDPRTFFQPPENFNAEIELPAEATQADALLFAARRLLVQLEGFLLARSSGIERFVLKLSHRDSITEIVIGLVAPAREATHFARLLRERMGTHALKEAVRAIAISAGDIQPLAAQNASFFMDDSSIAGNWARLVEQLRSKLGDTSVHGLAVQSEHRPECASIAVKPGTAQLQLPLEGRPFWMLSPPQPIHETDTGPSHQGRLELVAGPERIESGWWDGKEVARDYFVARSVDQSLLWIYRERPAASAIQRGGWYLHGIFA